MPLNLEPQVRHIFETNTLKLVVCQIRFPTLVKFDEDVAKRFSEFVIENYPRSEQERQIAVTVGPSAPEPTMNTFWRFRDLKNLWSVALARDFVSLETSAYVTYEDFYERLVPVLDAMTAIGLRVRERLGFRYINEIRHPDAASPRAWRRFLNHELLGLLGGDLLGDDILHATQDIRLRQDDWLIVLRHGYLGPEPTGGDPRYLLDFDASHDGGIPLEAAEVLGRLKTFHDTLHDLFEIAITDDLRDYLKIKEVIGVRAS
jgi:uncharacterized protein (TIGR04255 family)